MKSLEQTLDSKAPLPQGYVFVAKGNVYITRHCREKTRQAGCVLYIIHDQRTKLRVGLACPHHILRKVQANEKATAAQRRQQVSARDTNYIANARAILLRLFPRIPLGSAEEVLKHGYLKGSGRVGRSSTMSDSNKMIMAVTAHVRHRHTPYDALLREKGPGQAARFEARAQIRGQLLHVLREWGMVGQLRSLEPDTDLDTGNESSQDSSYASDNVLENSCVDIVDVNDQEPKGDKTWKAGSPVVFGSRTWKQGSPVVFGKKRLRGKTDKETLTNSIHAARTIRQSPKLKGTSKASKNRVQKTKTTKRTVTRRRPNGNPRSNV